jgi:zinc protease
MTLRPPSPSASASQALRRFAATAGVGLVAALLVLGPSVSLSAQVKNWPSERPPRPLAAHDVKFPPYAFRTLPNGLQVIAVSHHEEPAVSLRLIVRAGAAQDPERKPGVAALAANLLDQGTTTKSAEQIASTIDSIGGALGTGAGPDLSFINAVVMKDNLGLGLDLVSDLAQHPAFAKEEIERQRQQTLSGLKVSYDDPEYLANLVFDRLVYGFHPYGKPQSGTPETLAAITREDLVAFHRTWFGANNAILAVVGDVTQAEAFAGAERAFGSWGHAAADATKALDPPSPTRRLVIVDRPGAVQTEIRVGNIAIPRKHSDYLTLDVATKILGGEGANRLHRVLRSERGLTYGASADFNGFEQTGAIVARTNTRSETTAETLRLIIDEFWKLIRDPVGERELAGAQEYLTGSFPLTIETPSQIATRILNAVFFGLDLKELQTYRDRVNAITPEDVQRVARLYLHPDKLTIVLVGDASTFVKQLPAVGFDSFERIAVSDLDVSATNLRRQSTPAGGVMIRPASFMQPANASARIWIDKAIAAKGGVAKLRSVRTVRAEGTQTVRARGADAPYHTLTWIEYPNRYRMEADMPGGRIVQVFADGRFWIQDSSGAHEAPVSEPVRESVQRDMIPLLLNAAAGTLTVRGVDSDDPENAAVEVSGGGMSPVTLFINRDDGLVARSRYESASRPGRTEEIYSDYRNVDGLQVAFHTVIRYPGLAPIERDVRTFHYNVPLPAGLFVKPS